jgi:hypothetical protein
MCAGSAGPSQLLNGLYDANRTRASVLAVASTITSAEVGRSYFQESDSDTMFASGRVFNATCLTSEQRSIRSSSPPSSADLQRNRPSSQPTQGWRPSGLSLHVQ